jgi:ribonuclease D
MTATAAAAGADISVSAGAGALPAAVAPLHAALVLGGAPIANTAAAYADALTAAAAAAAAAAAVSTADVGAEWVPLYTVSGSAHGTGADADADADADTSVCAYEYADADAETAAAGAAASAFADAEATVSATSALSSLSPYLLVPDPRPSVTVNTPQCLHALLPLLAPAPSVAADLEFSAFPRYRPALELLQLATPPHSTEAGSAGHSADAEAGGYYARVRRVRARTRRVARRLGLLRVRAAVCAALRSARLSARALAAAGTDAWVDPDILLLARVALDREIPGEDAGKMLFFSRAALIRPRERALGLIFSAPREASDVPDAAAAAADAYSGADAATVLETWLLRALLGDAHCGLTSGASGLTFADEAPAGGLPSLLPPRLPTLPALPLFLAPQKGDFSSSTSGAADVLGALLRAPAVVAAVRAVAAADAAAASAARLDAVEAAVAAVAADAAAAATVAAPVSLAAAAARAGAAALDAEAAATAAELEALAAAAAAAAAADADAHSDSPADADASESAGDGIAAEAADGDALFGLTPGHVAAFPALADLYALPPALTPAPALASAYAEEDGDWGGDLSGFNSASTAPSVERAGLRHGVVAVVDAQALQGRLLPLLRLLQRKECVLHGGGVDLQVLQEQELEYGEPGTPGRLVDTQIAAGFAAGPGTAPAARAFWLRSVAAHSSVVRARLVSAPGAETAAAAPASDAPALAAAAALLRGACAGLPGAAGGPAALSLLASAVLGVPLAKGLGGSDWARRPLAPEQLAYAVDDVRWLHQMRRRLAGVLEALPPVPRSPVPTLAPPAAVGGTGAGPAAGAAPMLLAPTPLSAAAAAASGSAPALVSSPAPSTASVSSLPPFLSRSSLLRAESEVHRLTRRDPPPPHEAWLSLRGRPAGAGPAVDARLRALAQWREMEGLRQNRSPKFLLKDEVIVALARRPPTCAADIDTLGYQAAFAQRHADVVLQILRAVDQGGLTSPSGAAAQQGVGVAAGLGSGAATPRLPGLASPSPGAGGAASPGLVSPTPGVFGAAAGAAAATDPSATAFVPPPGAEKASQTALLGLCAAVAAAAARATGLAVDLLAPPQEVRTFALAPTPELEGTTAVAQGFRREVLGVALRAVKRGAPVSLRWDPAAGALVLDGIGTL